MVPRTLPTKRGCSSEIFRVLKRGACNEGRGFGVVGYLFIGVVDSFDIFLKRKARENKTKTKENAAY